VNVITAGPVHCAVAGRAVKSTMSTAKERMSKVDAPVMTLERQEECRTLGRSVECWSGFMTGSGSGYTFNCT
jgi:hypothetical protein